MIAPRPIMPAIRKVSTTPALDVMLDAIGDVRIKRERTCFGAVQRVAYATDRCRPIPFAKGRTAHEAIRALWMMCQALDEDEDLSEKLEASIAAVRAR